MKIPEAMTIPPSKILVGLKNPPAQQVVMSFWLCLKDVRNRGSVSHDFGVKPPPLVDSRNQAISLLAIMEERATLYT